MLKKHSGLVKLTSIFFAIHIVFMFLLIISINREYINFYDIIYDFFTIVFIMILYNKYLIPEIDTNLELIRYNSYKECFKYNYIEFSKNNFFFSLLIAIYVLMLSLLFGTDFNYTHLLTGGLNFFLLFELLFLVIIFANLKKRKKVIIAGYIIFVLLVIISSMLRIYIMINPFDYFYVDNILYLVCSYILWLIPISFYITKNMRVKYD